MRAPSEIHIKIKKRGKIYHYEYTELILPISKTMKNASKLMKEVIIKDPVFAEDFKFYNYASFKQRTKNPLVIIFHIWMELLNMRHEILPKKSYPKLRKVLLKIAKKEGLE